MANKKDNKVQKKLLKKLIKKEKKKPNEADTINKYKKQLEKTKLGVALKLIAKEKLTKQTSDKLLDNGLRIIICRLGVDVSWTP